MTTATSEAFKMEIETLDKGIADLERRIAAPMRRYHVSEDPRAELIARLDRLRAARAAATSQLGEIGLEAE